MSATKVSGRGLEEILALESSVERSKESSTESSVERPMERAVERSIARARVQDPLPETPSLHDGK
jgi:hypothetical protein